MTGLKVEKQIKEGPQRLVFRFIRKIKESGILFEAKKRQFYQPSPNPRAKKESALHRQKMKNYYEKLKKLGKI